MVPQTIAVVNNDLVLLDLLQELLIEAGYATTTYLTTDQTYQQLRDSQPSLIILDVGLQASAPGWPLLKLLHFDPNTMQIPVLVTTVDHTFIQGKQTFLQAAGCDVLELPASFTDLVAKVEALIGAPLARSLPAIKPG
ncbi:response regulator [Herpetosiphon llansteffanensis]|uniref:response regulator n=1 Tax=Herpetosiphon llansteffanensis TaxID=2094568 RepID=UPI000D7BAC1E|nr:response regulator [Herpetosiphon llansteffanensis]